MIAVKRCAGFTIRVYISSDGRVSRSVDVDPKIGGGLHALDLATGKILWSAKPVPCTAARTDCSPAQSAAVTAIPGVVFSGSVDGHLRGYSAATGEVLWDADTARAFETVNGKAARGGSMDAAGPAVVNGMVFVNSGYGQWGGMPGNVLLAFSEPESKGDIVIYGVCLSNG
jgi:polyvinyl alcohol dehydrogenase (cytochrome)